MQDNNNGKTALVQGRIVWVVGKSLFTGEQKRDFNTKQPKFNATGEPMMEFGFGLAVPKENLGDMKPGGKGELWLRMYEEAFTLYPNRVIPPSFAMKFKDCDMIDDKGQRYGAREGYEGCVVFALKTSLPIKFFKWDQQTQKNDLIPDGIKCGDYVNVQVSVKAHAAMGQGKAGLYLNPMAVQFLGYGKEIINMPSGDQIFGLAQPAMPQGASAMPTMPQGAAFPQAPVIPMAPSFAPPQVPVAPQPHYGVVPPVHQPPAGGIPQMGVPMPSMGNGFPAPAAAPMSPPTFAPPPGIPATANGFAPPAFPSSPQYQQPFPNGVAVPVAPQAPAGIPGFPPPPYQQS